MTALDWICSASKALTRRIMYGHFCNKGVLAKFRETNYAMNAIIALLADLSVEFVASDTYFLGGRGRQTKPATLGWVRQSAYIQSEMLLAIMKTFLPH